MLMAWLNIGGEWREIKMDCWFPTIDLRDKKGVKKGKLKWIMSEPSKHKGEMWPMILQKAYAKSHGGYHRILMGNFGEVLRDLTGAPVN